MSELKILLEWYKFVDPFRLEICMSRHDGSLLFHLTSEKGLNKAITSWREGKISSKQDVLKNGDSLFSLIAVIYTGRKRDIDL